MHLATILKSVLLYPCLLVTCFMTTSGHASILIKKTATVNQVIPDGDATGWVHQQTVSEFPVGYRIEEVEIILSLAGTGFGAWNGDLYAYLEHNGQIAILLNRSGKTAANSIGYSGNGYSGVRFDDDATKGDIHVYETTLAAGIGYTSPAPLNGTWAPDARHVDPGAVMDTDARTAFLAALDGLDPNGTWTLFVADLQNGGTAMIDHWTLEITAVPEPEAWTPCIAFCLILALLSRSRWTQPATQNDS